MKAAIWVTWCACLTIIVAGCSGDRDAPQNQPHAKPGACEKREISGEIFTRDVSGIIKQSGAMIYFLTPNERDKFDALVKEWRDRQYKTDQASWNQDYKEYSELFEKHKEGDGKVHDSDVIETLNSIKWRIEQTKMRIELKDYDKQIDLDDRTVKEFLPSTHWTAADSDGRFKVILPLAQECWVVAQSQIGRSRGWYFRWMPDGTSLVLSDANAM